MKCKSILLAATMALLAVVGCKKEEKVPAGLTVDQTTVSFTPAGGNVVVKVTSSDPWTLVVPSAAQGWLKVTPNAGSKGVTEVTLNTSSLEGKGRSTKINFIAGLYSASVSVVQEGTIPPGDGSKANPFSASEAYTWIMENLEDGKTTPTSQKYYVAGKIHKINTSSDKEQNYANTDDHRATFFISDDGEKSDMDFEAYKVYYLGSRAWREGDDDIKVGDEVVIYGQLKHYKSTAETGGNYDYLYSLNGETTGKAPAPDISKYETKTIAEFISLAKTDTYYVISGLVSGFQLEGNPTQCILTDETGSVQMYGVDDMGAFSVVKNDGILKIAAKYAKYEKDGKVTHEAVDCIFGSFVEGTSVEPKGNGTQADPYNPAGVIEYIKGLSSTPSANEVYIKGKVAKIDSPYSAEYGTAIFWISEDGSMKTAFECYSVKFLEKKDWVDGNTQIKLGDEVVVCSKVTIYNGVYETLSEKDGYKGYVYSLNGATSETPKPVIVIKSFKETASGVSAEWTAPEGVTSFTVALYKGSVDDANVAKSETVSDKKIEWTVALDPATKYILKVSGVSGETTISDEKELTTSAPAAANEIDFTKAPNKGTPSEEKVEWENEFITLTLTKETSQSAANNYLGGANAHTRVYKNQKMTFAVKSGKTIKSIVLVSTSADYAKKKITWTDAEAVVSGSNITVTPSKDTFSAVIEEATRFTKLTVNVE